MLKLEILPVDDCWDEAKEEFVRFEGATLQLEHSLVSLSRWESIWHKPFLSLKPDEARTAEEFKSYIACMSMTQSFDPKILNFLTNEHLNIVQKYIEDPMTATWFREDPKKHGKSGLGQVITSEYLYYLMFEAGIPKDCEKWHLNRLMTLLRIYAEKSKTNGKKPSQNELLTKYASINAARRAKLKK